MEALSPSARRDLVTDLRAVQEEISAGVVSGRSKGDAKIWAVWARFASTLGLDPFLQPLSDPVPILQVFARRVRDGRLALDGKPVRARTSEGYLRAVGQTFARLGNVDPRLNQM